MTDKVIEFTNKRLVNYLGDLQYFLEKRQYGSLRDVSLGKSALNNMLVNKEHHAKPDSNSDENQEQVKRIRKNIQNAEKKIKRIEEEQSKLEVIMGVTEKFGTAEYNKALKDYESNKKELELAMEEWEEAEMELERYS
jgi:ATP-binding cassette subfamily F protein 3